MLFFFSPLVIWCTKATRPISHILQALFPVVCLARWIGCSGSNLRRFSSQNVFHFIFLPPRHEPQTIQQWRYNTNRETLTSVPSHKNIKHQDCLVPSGLLYKIQSMFMIGFLNVIPMDWGFTLQFPHLLYNTALLLLNSQKQQLVRISGVLHNNKLRMIALNSVQDEGMYFIAS